ncbi:MAG: radical SAM protein [Phycisphaerae bacterium]|nr:radical SAM protein [Phycisphaerae bacterium]
MKKKKSRPFYRPFSLIFRQIISIWVFKLATRWPGMLFWIKNMPSMFKIAAGSTGIGCFGIDYHYVFELTSRCNLNCAHCHVGNENSRYNELSTEQVKGILDGLAEVSDFKLIVFSGGEPMLREDIYEILFYAKQLGLYPMLATNATLIDKEAAKALKQNGMLGIATSIDSVCPEKHNSYRGSKKAFEGVIAGIKNIRSEGLYIQVNITVSKYNTDELEEILMLADELGAHVVLLYQFIPTGKGVEIADSALDSQEFYEVIKRLHHVQSRISPVVIPVGLPEYFVYLSKKLSLPRWISRFVYKGCTAGGRGMFYIKPNGDLWPCPLLPVKIGNVLKNSPKDIWEKNEDILKLKNRKNLKGACGNCEHQEICGGCRARAYAYTKDLYAADNQCPFISHRVPEEI